MLNILEKPTPVGSKPNTGLFCQIFGKYNGCHPNSNTSPIFWAYPCIGHAKKLVGLVGAQTKRTLMNLSAWNLYKRSFPR
jgi:hypothetical protein